MDNEEEASKDKIMENETKENISTENSALNSANNKDIENVESIQKFLDEPENKSEHEVVDHSEDSDKSKDDNIGKNDKITDKELTDLLGYEQKDSEVIASNVVGMILNDAESNIQDKVSKSNVLQVIQKPSTIASTSNKGDKSMALSIGSKVEVRDFDYDWHPSEIVEVDFEEMEVLVRYADFLKRPDEWINVNSPRIRPYGIMRNNPSTSSENASSTVQPCSSGSTLTEDNKGDEKPKVFFSVGERCLARWRDNRKFMATVTSDLGKGKYEVLFDDGFKWQCSTSRLSKCKESIKTEGVDSPISPAESTTITGPNTPTPSALPFHTHLFDPTRDYLGSKSERRALKRKLNIKEIFNIGQKKYKKKELPAPKKSAERKPKAVKKEESTVSVQNEVPDAVASIIGTEVSNVKDEADVKYQKKIKIEPDLEKPLNVKEEVMDEETVVIDPNEAMDIESDESKDPVLDEEQILENFETPDEAAHAVIDRIKEAINKLEGGFSKQPQAERTIEVKSNPKPELDEETIAAGAEGPAEVGTVPEIPAEVKMVPEEPTHIAIEEFPKTEETKSVLEISAEDHITTGDFKQKHTCKVKKSKKLRLLQEKKVERQVQKVKSELEQMKKQMEEMRKQMLEKTEVLTKASPQLPESFLLPGEWCCKWVNGQPVGTVSEVEAEVKFDAHNKPVLPRRSVQVEDKRLPEGWAKHMVRRSFGNSAGKWDIVLMSPDNRRFHTRVEMRHYLDSHPELKDYERPLLDFGVHIKLARRMGWYTETPDGVPERPTPLPIGTLSTTSPLFNRKHLSLNKKDRVKKKKFKRSLKYAHNLEVFEDSIAEDSMVEDSNNEDNQPSIEDGYVWVGSLKVQVLENLLRCPAEGCFKNFRNNTLIKMHIKHYHRELRKMLGATPKVLDLAYERTKPDIDEPPHPKKETKTLKVKIPRPPKVNKAPETPPLQNPEIKQESTAPTTPAASPPRVTTQDSPKLRIALNKPVKRPKVLLPVRRPIDQEIETKEEIEDDVSDCSTEPKIEPLDFETAISTHTVTKPVVDISMKVKNKFSEDEEWAGVSSDVSRSSFPRSESPDSKSLDQRINMPPTSSGVESTDEKERKMYMYDENGDRIRIVHMKREEIINCHCGFREEDGLMVQCELCLCWQHALCHNIQREADVPEKYTCSICLNPRRGRRSKRFLHDQDRLYEGLLPGAKPCESLRRSHELSGNLLKIQDALHALRVSYHVATKKDHPKLYLWAKDWEAAELSITQERLNSDYSDLNIMISDIGKENLPVKDEHLQLDTATPLSDEPDGDRLSQKEGLSQCLLNGILSSPSCVSLDIPISTSDLERLAKTVQEQETRVVSAPEPEAAIDNTVCRERLLRHLQRCQALVDARLDCIDAQVAELESQDPSFEDDETADYFPRTKQTIQMLMRDLDVMEELGIIT